MANKSFLSSSVNINDVNKKKVSSIKEPSINLVKTDIDWENKNIKVLDPNFKPTKVQTKRTKSTSQGVINRVNPIDLLIEEENKKRQLEKKSKSVNVVEVLEPKTRNNSIKVKSYGKTNKNYVNEIDLLLAENDFNDNLESNINKNNTSKNSKKLQNNQVKTTNQAEEIASIKEEVVVKNTHRATNTLKIVFLGGVGEIGENMMALEYGQDIIVIDCGSSFPDDTLPGIDLVVPEIDYLLDNKERVKGIVLTHGHEDHIGSLPYVLDELEVPVFGSNLTIGLVENKLREFPKIKADLRTIIAGDTIKLGKNFKVEFIPVCHSIPGAMALAITTPSGVMVHTGDFKIDFTPIGNVKTDLARLSALGEQGVLLLTCESTNIERQGFSMSEKTVGKTLEEIFIRYSKSRIVVATFASNIHRLQQVLSLCETYKRKVVFTGRSMINVAEIAYKLGELKFNRNIIIESEQISKYKDEEILILCTGSQGEPNSALTRMANEEFNRVKLTSNDTVVISASPIPGNEKSINSTINKLYKIGCEVIYSELADVHVSGHACQEEIKTIHNLVKPKYFIPVHGEYRHLMHHKNLAISMGMHERNIKICDIGNRVEVGKNGIKILGNIQAGKRLVDGLGIGDSESNVLKERIQLAEDGLCVAILGISQNLGKIVTGPEIVTRGLIYKEEGSNLLSEAKQFLLDNVKTLNLKYIDMGQFRLQVRKILQNYFVKKIKRKPMVVTILLEN